jgi:hypothetical protein
MAHHSIFWYKRERIPGSGGKDKRKEFVTPVSVTTPSKRGRPSEDPLVFVSTNPTSTLNIPLGCSTRLKN